MSNIKVDPITKKNELDPSVIIVGSKSPMSLLKQKNENKGNLIQKKEKSKYFEVFLTRVNTDQTDEMVKEHLANIGLNYYDFRRLQTMQIHCLSFYFKVDVEQKEYVLKAENWPKKVLVKEFVRY